MKKINDKFKLKIAAQAAEIEKLKEAHSSCAINLQKLQKSKAKIDNKYQILGQNWEILVNNCENECLRREMKGIKRVCDDHQIDPKQYAFKDIPADKDFLDDPEGDEDDSDDERTESDDDDDDDDDDDQEESENDEQASPENSESAGEDDVEREEAQDEDDEEVDLEEDDEDADMNGTR